jgi:antitoxin VapB
MGLNIKNPETIRLAKELAALTGESLTGAITVALIERLECVRREEKRPGLAERLLAIGRETAPLLKGAPKPSEIGDFLYDERGLPK